MNQLKITCVVLALLILSSMSANAQSKKASAGLGFYSAGVQFFAPRELKQFFPVGYPDMEFSLFTSSGAGYGMVKSFIYGWEGGGYTGGPFIKDDIQVDLEGSFSSFRLGYLVFAKNKFLVYPLLGLSMNSLDFFIHKPDQTMVFSSITQDPLQATTLSFFSTNLDISLNVNYLVGGKMTDNGGGGFMLGLQVGYQAPPFSTKWTYDNGGVTDGPGFNMDGFYVRLLIGGGGVGYQN